MEGESQRAVQAQTHLMRAQAAGRKKPSEPVKKKKGLLSTTKASAVPVVVV